MTDGLPSDKHNIFEGDAVVELKCMLVCAYSRAEIVQLVNSEQPDQVLLIWIT